MATHIAKEKVWRTHKNELVGDGHEAAAQLVAPKGGEVSSEELAKYKNADDFFVEDGTTAADKAKRETAEPKKPWTNAEIQAYRNAREGDEPTASTITRMEKTSVKKEPPAEKVRKSRPGPDKTSVKVKKAPAKKAP
ncbi:MAG: hypothetical protein QOI07_928 [Verrucomicrobiota bacterium]